VSEWIPVDLDAVEERVVAQWSLRTLAEAAASLAGGGAALHLTAGLATTAHLAAASLAAAGVWTGLRTRVDGAPLPVWGARILAYATAPHLFLPGADSRRSLS
jgi:hypothetical protein